MNRKRTITTICFLFYIFTVLWYTVLSRDSGFHEARYELFWSYKEWLAGNMGLGKEILANIAMFIPFGFLASSIFSKHYFIVPAAIIFSLIIEFLQLFLSRGLFEFDDVISNTIGAVIGIVLYSAMEKLLMEKYLSALLLAVSIIVAVICLFVLF